MRPITFLFASVVLALCCRLSTAQCQLEWSSGGPQSQLSGSAQCTTLWDPDGAGPLPQHLVIGGTALMAGDEPTNQRVMTWNGTEWAALGTGPGVGGTVHALTTWNGQLVAGGHLVGGGINNIALWDGSAWQPLGSGFPNVVDALTVWNGNLVAAGFTSAPTNGAVIMTWNGTAWTALPSPPLLTIPSALTTFQGFLCVGGYRPVPYQGVLERWNGTSWSASITADANIHCLAVRAVSLVTWLYVGGSFTTIGGVAASRVASCGSTFAWSAVGNGLPQPCLGLHVRSTSPLVPVVVALTNYAHQLDNTTGTWGSMGGLLPLTSVNYYGGVYHGTSEAGDNSCVRYNSPNWVPVRGPGIDGELRAATRMGDDMIVGGTFSAIGATTASRIARWDGTTFQPLGTGMVGQVSAGLSVDSLRSLTNGDVVAGGLFVSAGGVTANSIARWNGTTWSSLGSGVDQQVLAICEMPNGDLIAGGWFNNASGVPCARIARWNGTAWSPLGTGMNAAVQALALRADGTLFAGGSFTVAGGVACNRIAQWNGSAWLPVGTGCNGTVFDLAVRPNGDVVAVGSFTSAGGLPADRCARWTAAGWTAMGAASADNSPVQAVLALPNGDVVVGQGFHTPGNDPDEGLSRWNGSTWTGLGTLGAHFATQRVLVRCLAQAADGDLVIGGDFSVADGVISRNLAKVESTCMPLVSPYGAGCSSAAGPLVITADTLPWIGTSFRTTTTGIAPLSLCIGVIGLSQVSIPLDLLLAEGQPGCTLLAALDILLFLQNGPGTAHSAFNLEADPSLIGVTFYQQTAPLEFDAGGAIVAIRSSNALAGTIGTL